MRYFFFCFIFIISYIFSSASLYAQCETWTHHPKQKEITASYILYRQSLKNGNFKIAFENWSLVYKNTPAADGHRSSVYTDGVKMLEEQFKQANRKKKKRQIVDFIFQLIKEQKRCFPNSNIISPSKNVLDFSSEI